MPPHFLRFVSQGLLKKARTRPSDTSLEKGESSSSLLFLSLPELDPRKAVKVGVSCLRVLSAHNLPGLARLLDPNCFSVAEAWQSPWPHGLNESVLTIGAFLYVPTLQKLTEASPSSHCVMYSAASLGLIAIPPNPRSLSSSNGWYHRPFTHMASPLRPPFPSQPARGPLHASRA